MKALILNSGMGTRMGVLASEHPKCMTEISPQETLLSRQLNQLYEAGIREVVMTTGRFERVLVNYCESLDLPINIIYCNNPRFTDTNYIYSIYLAREYLDDDILLMHGDLVFDSEILENMLANKGSCMAVSSTVALPEKDFKAVIKNGIITKVGIEFYNDAKAAQPLYKLNRKDWQIWLDKIIEFCESGNTSCYAENAFNEVSESCCIYPYDCKNMLCGEVDTAEDLAVMKNRLQEIENRSVYMCFATDIIHAGHMRLIRKARKLGKLTIGILSDEAISQYRRASVLSAEDRKEMMSNIVGVSRVVDQDTLSYKKNLLKLKPDIVVHGDDWKTGYQKEIREEVIAILSTYGGKLVEYPYTHDEKYESIDRKIENSLYANHRVLEASPNYAELDGYIRGKELHSIMLVHGASLNRFPLKEYFYQLPHRLNTQIVYFSDFKPNPAYESVVNGVRLFKESGCDGIIAIGGGSAMDVAKCIKLFANMKDDEDYLDQKIVPNEIPLIAIPTTAGTGSEATRFAVVYRNGEKLSITDSSCIPALTLFDVSLLDSLPLYQRKATMMDALCHAIESSWSINSTEESRKYAHSAIELVIKYKDAYLNNEKQGNRGMMEAAYLAGKAINISQTTSAHAMSYKLTSLFGLAHGHAVAICLRKIFPYMLKHLDKTVDPRGKGYLRDVFQQISECLGCRNPEEGALYLENMINALEFDIPEPTEEQYRLLAHSVNIIRLKNNPVELSVEDIDELYHQILR